LQHPNSHVRWHAARGLGQIGDTQAIEVLAEGLFDENQSVRWVTARVLASLNSTAIPAILNVLTRNRLSEPFRQAVHHALHAMPSRLTQEYLQPLLLALRSPAANVEAPRQAQRMLLDWKVSQPGKAERSSK
jgi:HEAT repeat protein